MSVISGTYQREIRAHYQRALDLLEAAREAERRQVAMATEVRQLVGTIETVSGSSPGDALSRSLHHWGREMMNGNFTAASIHLSRVGVELGLRGSDARPWSVEPPSRAALTPVSLVPEPLPAAPVRRPAFRAAPEPVKASAPPAQLPPASKPTPVASAPASGVDNPLSPLSPEEQALVLALPLAEEPLHGANELAECWGNVMNPTSARGRYSRLANKLRDHHGRDLLLRGRGRYARLKGWT
jgi:hypothetical protein